LIHFYKRTVRVTEEIEKWWYQELQLEIGSCRLSG